MGTIKTLPTGLNSLSTRMPSRQNAFTLLELMIVLAIIAIGSAVIIPRISNTEGKIFRAQLRELSAVLKYNRRNAVIKGQIREAVLYPYQENPNSTVEKGHWQSSGASVQWLEKASNTDSKPKPFTIQFFPQGGATGGTLLLKQGRFQSKLIIDSFTGKLTLDEMQQNE